MWGQPASAAPVTPVDFTVEESIPTADDAPMLGNIVGCESATVDTTDASVRVAGPMRIFTATKFIDCGGGNTITLTLRASVTGCAATDSGTWKAVDGTGTFAGVKGSGHLVGTYDTLDACTATGISDHYTGHLKV